MPYHNNLGSDIGSLHRQISALQLRLPPNAKTEEVSFIKIFRDWTDPLIKAIPAIGLFLGFILLVVYSWSVGRFPRASASEITLMLLAMSAVAIFTVALLLFVSVMPGRIAVQSTDEDTDFDVHSRFFALVVFFFNALLIWHGVVWTFQYTTRATSFLSIHAHNWSIFADHSNVFAFIVVHVVGLTNGILASKAIYSFFEPALIRASSTRMARVVKLALYGAMVCLMENSLAPFSFVPKSSLEYTIVVITMDLGILLLRWLALRMSKQSSDRTKQTGLRMEDLMISGWLFVIPPIMALLIEPALLNSTMALGFYIVVAALNAYLVAPIVPASSIKGLAIVVLAVLATFFVFSPALARTSMARLGFGNLLVTEMVMTRDAYQSSPPPSGAQLTAENKDPKQVCIRKIRLAYDLGNELVFSVPVITGTTKAYSPWVLPKSAVQHYHWAVDAYSP